MTPEAALMYLHLLGSGLPSGWEVRMELSRDGTQLWLEPVDSLKSLHADLDYVDVKRLDPLDLYDRVLPLVPAVQQLQSALDAVPWSEVERRVSFCLAWGQAYSPDMYGEWLASQMAEPDFPLEHDDPDETQDD